jgi:arylsulfatase
VLAGLPALIDPALAQAPGPKPNILFIMGDDIGGMQVGVYHRGLAL